MKEIVIACTCPLCGAITDVTVSLEQYNKYKFTDALIQDVFPELSLQTRETIISGMCFPCQEGFFDDDEDDYEDDDDWDVDNAISEDMDPYHCDDDCDFCQDYDCPLNTNEDN